MGNARTPATGYRTTVRDINECSILQRSNGVTVISDLTTGEWFPDPVNPSTPFNQTFAITQIIVVSDQDFYWTLQTSIDPLGNPQHPSAVELRGSAIAKVMMSIPLTIALRCYKDTFARFIADADMGGAPTPGSCRIQLLGFWDMQVQRRA